MRTSKEGCPRLKKTKCEYHFCFAYFLKFHFNTLFQQIHVPLIDPETTTIEASDDNSFFEKQW